MHHLGFSNRVAMPDAMLQQKCNVKVSEGSVARTKRATLILLLISLHLDIYTCCNVTTVMLPNLHLLHNSTMLQVRHTYTSYLSL